MLTLFFTKLILFATLATIGVFVLMTTLVSALPGGGDLSAGGAIMEERLPTPYVGVCFDNKKCDEGTVPGHTHDVAGDGKSNIALNFACDSFLPTIGDGYVCKSGCGASKGGCSKLTDGKCMTRGPYKTYCA